MDFNEFDEACKKTDLGTSAQDVMSPGWLYYVLGMPDEVGEMCGKIKKLFRDKGGVVDEEFITMLTKEAGDVLWYMSRLLNQFDVSFEEVAVANVMKLQGRMERGTLHGDGDDR